MASIRKRSVRGEVRWDVTVTRLGAPRQTRTFATRTAAEGWARDVERNIERGTWRSTDFAERTSVAALLQRYGADVLASTRSPGQWLSIARQTSDGDLGRIPLSGLTPERVATYRDKRCKERVRGRTRSTQSVRHEIGLLKRAIDHGIREWGLNLPQGNPVDYVKLPAAARARNRRLSSDEARKLMEEAYASKRAPTLGAAIEFATETAMRRSELCALRWADVDLRRKVAAVRESKNGEPRDVPLTPRAAEILSRLPRPIRGGSVFGLRPGGFSQAFRRLTGRLGLADIRLHDLRHEGTSRLAERLGGDVMALSSITGHKTLAMLKRYTHLRAEDLARRLSAPLNGGAADIHTVAPPDVGCDATAS